MTENEAGTVILDAAFTVFGELGSSLLESVYEAALAHELRHRGLFVVRQAVIPVRYRGIELEEGFRADLVVEKKVLVELKSVERLLPVHGKQVLTYLRLSGLSLGYLINFGSPVLKDGIQRIVNKFQLSKFFSAFFAFSA